MMVLATLQGAGAQGWTRKDPGNSGEIERSRFTFPVISSAVKLVRPLLDPFPSRSQKHALFAEISERAVGGMRVGFLPPAQSKPCG